MLRINQFKNHYIKYSNSYQNRYVQEYQNVYNMYRTPIRTQVSNMMKAQTFQVGTFIPKLGKFVPKEEFLNQERAFEFNCVALYCTCTKNVQVGTHFLYTYFNIEKKWLFTCYFTCNGTRKNCGYSCRIKMVLEKWYHEVSTPQRTGLA